MKKSSGTDRSALDSRRLHSVLVAVLLVFVVLLSVGSGVYVGASFFPQQAPNVTTTTTIFTTTTSWTTSTIWSTVTQVVQGVLTTIEYTTSTSTVTVTGSTGPDTSTMLLLHMDGTDGSQNFVDNSLQAHSVTAKGSARISTAQSKFGGASGLFGGAGDYLSLADSADWAFGTGSWTVDFWVRFNSVAGEQVFFSQGTDGNHYCSMEFVSGTGLTIFDYNGGWNYKFRSSWSPSINTWYHLAFERDGNTPRIFIDGVAQTVTEDTTVSGKTLTDYASALRIGIVYDGVNYPLKGWLDEFRVSKGIARWTSNFTPPTAPY